MKDCTYGIASCGNCVAQFSRRIEVTNLKVENLKAGQFIVAVNSNFNDQIKILFIKSTIIILFSLFKRVFPVKILKVMPITF